MDPGKQGQLRDVSLKHETLFDGVLETFPGQSMHIDLIPWATPFHRRPHPVSQVHLETFTKELDHLKVLLLRSYIYGHLVSRDW